MSVVFRGDSVVSCKRELDLSFATATLVILMSVFHDPGRCWSDANLQELKKVLEQLTSAGGWFVPKLDLYLGHPVKGYPMVRHFEEQKQQLDDLRAMVTDNPDRRTNEVRQQMLKLIADMVGELQAADQASQRFRF